MPHEHDFSTLVSHADATCAAKAHDVYDCACGETQTVETSEMDTDNHAGEIKTYGYQTATETANGFFGNKDCAACGELVEVGHMLEHTGNATPDPPVNTAHGTEQCGRKR